MIMGISVALAQQSSAPSSTPQLSKYTAAPKGAELVLSHSTVRLLEGEFRDGKWTAGVEIVLKPGWKTYWRVPGDAGVPSEFVWTNSTNVKKIDVQWPAPKRYKDITGKSIGYKNHVIFPVTVTPAINGAPTKLDLRLYYAICSDICIPAQANLGLELSNNRSVGISLQRIRKFAALVPRTDAKGVSVTKAVTKDIAGKMVLAITLAGKVAAKTDILVEGSGVAYFGAPERVSKGDGQQVFHLSIDGLDKPDELNGETLILTVLSGDIRLQTDVKIN